MKDRSLQSLMIAPPIWSRKKTESDIKEMLRQATTQWRAQLRQRARTEKSAFTPDSDIYFIDVSLSALEDSELLARVMSIPTNLSLTDGRVNDLLLVASTHQERQGVATPATEFGDGGCKNPQ